MSVNIPQIIETALFHIVQIVFFCMSTSINFKGTGHDDSSGNVVTTDRDVMRISCLLFLAFNVLGLT